MLPYLRFHHIGIAVPNIERTVNQYVFGGGIFGLRPYSTLSKK